MVQKTFGIYSDQSQPNKLFIEFGTTHIACWTIDTNNALLSFEFFSVDDNTKIHLRDVYRETKLYSKLLGYSFRNIEVVLDNECCVLVPEMQISDAEKNELLHLALGESRKTEKRMTKDTVNYLFPVHHHLTDILNREFPNAQIKHKFSVLNHTLQQTPTIQLTCYLEHFIISVIKDDTILLVQRLEYETPEDVVYYILNICKHLHIELSDVPVLVQGLIETESELYAELYKYIPNLQLREPNIRFASEAFNEYPAHYFSSFVNELA